MSNYQEHFRPDAAHNNGQHYIESSIRLASPGKLRLMVIERAIETAGRLSALWRSSDYELGQPGSNEQSIQLMDLLNELLSGVAGGSSDEESKLCQQVSDLYVFLLKHLVVAESKSDASSVDEIKIVLEAEAETWRAVVAQESTAAMDKPSQGPSPSSGGLNFSA